jgi:hypothetical protein
MIFYSIETITIVDKKVAQSHVAILELDDSIICRMKDRKSSKRRC